MNRKLMLISAAGMMVASSATFAEESNPFYLTAGLQHEYSGPFRPPIPV